MSILSAAERRLLEDVLQMGSGYVLDFTDASYAEFFRDHGVDIDHDRYHQNGGSKAKRMRTFWRISPPALLANVLGDLLDYAEVAGGSVEPRHRHIVARLDPSTAQGVTDTSSESEFLAIEFGDISLDRLNLDSQISAVIEQRLDEMKASLQHGAPLAAILLAGSTLEGLLLNSAMSNPRAFNQAQSAPKDSDGKTLRFPEWSLAQLINAACELGFIGLDTKKFSHALRDFRNYIHPYQQAQSGFSPSAHTAQICWQVLRAAVASLVHQRDSQLR